jgi:hypothetical protein
MVEVGSEREYDFGVAAVCETAESRPAWAGVGEVDSWRATLP